MKNNFLGVLGSPRTCLHGILSLLQVSGSDPALAVSKMPESAELSYQLLTLLSSLSETCDPTLRYLHNSHQFLTTHIGTLPFTSNTGKREGYEEISHYLTYINHLFLISWDYKLYKMRISTKIR